MNRTDQLFWSKVAISSDASACWPFVGGVRTKEGYGVVRYAGGITTANRAAYRSVNGEIEDGNQICHSCDNPPCCNPFHLWSGTPRENIADMLSKGRKPRLSHDQVAAIRAEPGTGASVARKFNVSETSVSRIRNGVRHFSEFSARPLHRAARDASPCVSRAPFPSSA